MQYVTDCLRSTYHTISHQKSLLFKSFGGENLGALVVLITGIALKIFRFKAGDPLIVQAIAFFSGKFVIKIGQNYHIYLINHGVEQLRSFLSKNPKLHRFCFIFSLVICKKAPKFSRVSAFIAGFLAAFILGSPPKQNGSEDDDRATLF